MRRRRRTAARVAAVGFAWWALAAAGADDRDGTCPIPPPPDRPVQAAPGDPASAEGRNDITAWRGDEARSLPAIAALRSEEVASILRGIEKPSPPQPSWWDRLMARFDEWLRLQSGDAAAPAWLRDLLSQVSEEAVTAILWLLLCLLVIAMGGIVIMELRAAGIGRRRRAASAGGALPLSGTATADVPPSLAQVMTLPLRAQPAALLRLAIHRLAARQLLPPDDSLTNGELLRLLETHATVEAAAFRRLARGADAVVYGARELPREEVAALFEALGALDRAPA